ncbi:MAG: hypothetical protein NC092_05875 [Butyrivibrio sp.]|nr:hypothetical protein [Butyrivibrio sp.]
MILAYTLCGCGFFQKSEYDTKEDAFNARMQEYLKEKLESEAGIEQADITVFDDKITFLIRLTFEDSVVQEDREALAKRVETVVQKMLYDRRVIVELEE